MYKGAQYGPEPHLVAATEQKAPRSGGIFILDSDGIGGGF
jgi:hypothetical protein